MFPHLDPHFEFDTEFGKTLKNQRFHHFLYCQKSLKIASKYLSNLYKIRLQSNSTENRIYNKEITPLNKLIYKSKIPQNISKINTFTQHKIHKQHHSIEVIIFYHQIYIKLISKKSIPTYISSHHHSIAPNHTQHSLPAIIRLNYQKSTQISIKTISMIKVSSEK